jgi:leucyl aminopeptidase
MGKISYGGACAAAAFLENFVEKGTKWCHMDIARANHENYGVWGIRSIIEFLMKQV